MPGQAHALRRTSCMKRVVALVVLAGCRFGFAEHDPDVPDGPGPRPDATPILPGHCGATKIAGYDLGATGMVDIAAAKVADGYAIGTTTADSILFGVHLDDQLVPNAATPFQTTPASGYPGHYSNGSLYFDGANLVGGLSVNDGTRFLKQVLSDMTSFGNYIQRTEIGRAN